MPTCVRRYDILRYMHRTWITCLFALLLALAYAYPQPQAQPSQSDRFRQMSLEAETKGLAEPFKGVTTNGAVQPGLFPIRYTGVSTETIRRSVAYTLHQCNAIALLAQ